VEPPWDTVLEWTPPHARWFTGGELNASVNCVDRHVATPRRNKAAIVWEGEPGDTRTLTYWDLYREVNQFANVLDRLGVKRGDRVAIYLPMIPEAVVAMLACARIGAVHSVVFGGFSPEALRDRINDSQCKVLITADGGYRRGQILPLKRNADKALAECPSIEHVVVVQRRPGSQGDAAFTEIKEGRDHWWHRLMREARNADGGFYRPPEAMNAEDQLFILYTSGTTGKPKGIVHSTGGYLTGAAATTKYVFDLREEDVYWCTADIGWVTGHSYIVYGPLANGATCVLYEGAPDWPEKDRFWAICERYGVTVFYTAPTAIRAFMKWGREYPAQYDLSSLRLLGSWASRSTPRRGCGTRSTSARPLPDRRHVVADRDGRDHDLAPPRPHRHQARLGHGARSPASRRRCSTPRPTRSRRAAGCSPSPARGRRCCAPSGATTSATSTPTSPSGRAAPTSTSPATAPSATRTATTGSSAASTTCSTWPATASAPWRSRARSSTTRASPRRRWWASTTTSRGRRSPRSSRCAPASSRAASCATSCATTWARRSAPSPSPTTSSSRRPAQDALGQDHAPPAARHRRGPRARRHHHAGRPERGGVAQGAVREPGELSGRSGRGG
jgi:hypothetical protein